MNVYYLLNEEELDRWRLGALSREEGVLKEAIPVDPARWSTTPFAHQVEGVKLMMKRRVVALFDETGACKTKQVIDAACTLFEASEIDVALVVAPAQVKDVWLDADFGEVTKHCWSYASIVEYDAKNAHFEVDQYRRVKIEDARSIAPTSIEMRAVDVNVCDVKQLAWVVTSYEFLRQEDARGDFPRVEALVRKVEGKRVFLICDESSALNNHKALQTRAVATLRKFCDRVVIMNGTPDDPMTFYSQYAILDKRILGYQNFYHFRAKHAILGGFKGKQVRGIKDLDVITRKTAPYTLRRMKADCLDLPGKLPPTFITTTLSTKTWKLYQQLKEEFYVELERGTLLAQNAAVKTLRLAQLTSGFLGGWFNSETDEPEVEEVSDEKTSELVRYLEQRYSNDERYQAIIWCRFRPEIARLFDRLRSRFKDVAIESLVGGQSKQHRKSAVELLHPESDYDGPVLLVGQPQAGRFGLNFTKANHVVNLSRDYSLMNRKQSEDRVDRPGQKRVVDIVDVLTSGPSGEKTVDHHQYKILLNKTEVARLTTEGWKKILREEM